jgi:hypothetical protein
MVLGGSKSVNGQQSQRNEVRAKHQQNETQQIKQQQENSTI